MTGRLFAYAKINLWLRIFAPDETGYHPLDTLFCAIDLADEITLEPDAGGLTIDVAGADLGPGDRNLAYRAAHEFFRTTGIQPGTAIRLNKKIPAGGGLGGGSSDAACVLLALNELHQRVLSDAELLALGARLGSDVPFFLCGSVLARAAGRGEVLRGLPVLPSAPLLVVVPDFAVATADAYRWLDDAGAYSAPMDSGVQVENWTDVAEQACNDFESVLFRMHPGLRDIRDALRQSGAQIAQVSGSGSALFGLYASEADRARAGALMRQNFPDARIISAATRA